MDMPLLQNLLLLFALAIFLLIICHRLGVPAIVGFLLAGVLGGPGTLGIIKESLHVEQLANLGIILLLFTIGLEFSIRRLLEYRRYFLIGGMVQVALTVLGGFLVSKSFGRPLNEAIFLGCLLSMSSTAVVLRILQERGITTTPAGKAILGILIFQDIVAIPMLLLVPMLSGSNHVDWGTPFWFHIGGGIFLLGVVLAISIFLMPRLLHLVAMTRSRELFLLTVLVACFSVAWLTSVLGLSVSIGAFLAGLIISDSQYSTEAISDILPFRDLFTSFFFISIGMLCDIQCLLQNPFLVLSATIGVVLLKSFLAGVSFFTLGLPLKAATLGGVALSQVGEFSFVLAKAGADNHLGTPLLHQMFLDVSLLTMALTPLLIASADKISYFLLQLPLPHWIKTGFHPAGLSDRSKSIKDHVVIVGYGTVGRHLSQSLREHNIPYQILDLNSETVKREHLKGEPIHYGDASHESVLSHLRIEEARALAVLINDPLGALRVIEIGRKLNPNLYIVGRTRRMHEVTLMTHLGADEVVPDEFGTSIEVFSRILKLYQIPAEKISAIFDKLNK